MNKSWMFVFFVILLILPLVSADKILTTPGQGLQINSWSDPHHTQNQQYIFTWDVSDSQGMLLLNTQTNCSFFLIQAGTTNQIAAGIATRTPDNYGWYKVISAPNFTNLGQYNYQIDCFLLTNSTISGNLLDSFEVTPNGNLQTTSEAISYSTFVGLLFVLMLLFGFIGYKLLDNDLLWPAGSLLLGLAILMGIYNVWLLYELKLNYTGTFTDADVAQNIFFIFMIVLVAGLMTAFFLLFTKWKVLVERFKNALKPEDDKDDLY